MFSSSLPKRFFNSMEKLKDWDFWNEGNCVLYDPTQKISQLTRKIELSSFLFVWYSKLFPKLNHPMHEFDARLPV